MSQVFFSHVEEDYGVVQAIATSLEAAGYRTWYYERDSVPGPSYLNQILGGIAQSQAVVLVLSAHALQSFQVDKEVIHAHESDIPFVPILVGLTHAQFKERRPDWAMMTGAAVSLTVPPEGAAAVGTRIVAGLKMLGIQPSEMPAPEPDGGATSVPATAAELSLTEASPASPDWQRLGVAAALSQRYRTDQHHFLEGLASLLTQVLPGQVTVERRGGLFSAKAVRAVMADLGDWRYGLQDGGHGALSATRAHVVRGIVLRTEPLEVRAWLDALGQALEQQAQADETTRAALAGFTGADTAPAPAGQGQEARESHA